MKYLDKLINFIFSLVILVLSIIVIMVSAGFIEYTEVDNYIRGNIFSEENNTTTCIVAIVTVLAALKTTIFLSKTNVKKKSAIMVDTNNGKIQIAQETIENTARSAIKDYEEVRDAQVRMIKEKKGVNIYMVLLVLPNTNIIELSSKVQDDVKEAIEDTTGVKVNNVDIKIKNITDVRKVKNKEKVDVKIDTSSEETVILEGNTEMITDIPQNNEVLPSELNQELVNESVEENNENK